MELLKILVSGAGIAGNALALWLSKLGHYVTVVERWSCLRATGLQIDLRNHGIEILKRMGLEKAFRDKAVTEEGLEIIDQNGKKRAYFPANKTGKGAQDFTSEYEIMRGDLCRLLHDNAKERVKYTFETSIEEMEEGKDRVHVRFADGTVDQFDLVIGADGVRSRTRKMMHSSQAADGFQPLSDTYVGYFTVPRPVQVGEKYVASWHLAPGGRMLMTRRSRPHELQVYLGGKISSERMRRARHGDVEEEKAALAEALQGQGKKMDEALQLLETAKDFYCERLGLVRLTSWSKGRIVLIGDAAYCPSVNSGMGTTSAVMGAYILAGEIGERCTSSGRAAVDRRKSLMSAIAAYEQKFRPFMEKILDGASDTSSWDRMSTPFGIAVMNCFLGLASFFHINVFNMMRQEEVKGWELPRYEVLEKC